MPFKIPTVVLLLLLAFNDRTVCEALQIDITNFSTPTTRFAMTLLELEDHPWLPRNVWDVRKYTYASKDFMNKHDDETQDSNSHQSRSNYFIDLIQFNGSSMVCEENGFVTFSGYGLRENAKIASTVQLRDPPGQFVYFVCTKTQMLTFYDNHLVDANYGCSSQAADPHTAICEYVVGMQFTLTSVGSYVWSDEWVTTQQDDYVPLIVKCNETATINPTNISLSMLNPAMFRSRYSELSIYVWPYPIFFIVISLAWLALTVYWAVNWYNSGRRLTSLPGLHRWICAAVVSKFLRTIYCAYFFGDLSANWNLDTTKIVVYSILFATYRFTMFTAFCLASKGWGICRQQLLAAEKICIGLLAIFITTSMIYGDLASVSTVFSSLVLLIVFYQFIIDNITNAIADLSSYIADVTSNQERQWRIADRQAVVKTIRDSAALERSIKASFVKGTINFSPDSGSGIPSNTNNPEKAIAENISNNKTETLFDKMDPEERYIEYHNNNLSLLHQLWNLFVLYAGLAFIKEALHFFEFIPFISLIVVVYHQTMELGVMARLVYILRFHKQQDRIMIL